MKLGFTISIIAHVLLLAVLLVSFSKPFPQDSMETEQISVTLAPLGDSLSLQQGEQQAEKKAKAAPKPTEKPEVKPDAEHVGDANIDTALPVKPQEKPREVKAPPPPQGVEEGKVDAEPEIKPAAAKEQEQPKPAAEEKPKPAEEKALPPAPAPPAIQPAPAPPAPAAKAQDAKAELKEEAPQDDIGDFLKTEAADKPVDKPPEKEPPQEKPKPVLPLPVPPQKPEKPVEKPKAPAAPVPPKPAAAKPAPAKGEKGGAKAADSQNALIDRTRTQGGGAKRSEGEAALGARKTIGKDDNLQQTVNNLVGGCVQRSWDIGVLQGSAAYDLRVQMRFTLKQDGSLAAEPDLTPSGGDQKDRDVIVVQARAALMKCVPFRLPADRYEQWRDITINMKAFPD